MKTAEEWWQELSQTTYKTAMVHQIQLDARKDILDRLSACPLSGSFSHYFVCDEGHSCILHEEDQCPLCKLLKLVS